MSATRDYCSLPPKKLLASMCAQQITSHSSNKLRSRSSNGAESDWCQTAILSMARHPFAVMFGCCLFSFAIRYLGGLVKHSFPRIVALEGVCIIARKPCWPHGTDGSGESSQKPSQLV